MINNVTLIGRLTRDAELRYTPSNIATAQFNIACNRNFKNANGEYDADFINCVMWREQAERFCNWTSMTEQMPPNYANPMDIDESDLPF